MLITGSAIFVEPGSDQEVLEKLNDFQEVTFQVKSESGTELVVNLEADGHKELERICQELRDRIPQIVEITHFYINFEDELEKIEH